MPITQLDGTKSFREPSLVQIRQEKSMKMYESCYAFLKKRTNRVASWDWFFARLSVVLIARVSLGPQEGVWIRMGAQQVL